jgi:hypothetical protein
MWSKIRKVPSFDKKGPKEYRKMFVETRDYQVRNMGKYSNGASSFCIAVWNKEI